MHHTFMVPGIDTYTYIELATERVMTAPQINMVDVKH